MKSLLVVKEEKRKREGVCVDVDDDDEEKRDASGRETRKAARLVAVSAVPVVDLHSY